MRTLSTLAFAALVSAALFSPAHAQVLYGSIVGQVSDASGAIVPGATVKLTQQETNQIRTAVTNASGDYSFPSVPSGTYDVSVSKEGFQAYNARGVALAAGTTVRVDGNLRVGTVADTVLVTAESALLQTDRAEVR